MVTIEFFWTLVPIAQNITREWLIILIGVEKIASSSARVSANCTPRVIWKFSPSSIEEPDLVPGEDWGQFGEEIIQSLSLFFYIRGRPWALGGGTKSMMGIDEPPPTSSN